MSGDNKDQPNFDESFFNDLLNAENANFDTLIKTIPSMQYFITALDSYVTEKQSNDEDGLSDEQWQILGTLLYKLKTAEPAKLDDLDSLSTTFRELDEFDDPNSLTTAGSFFPGGLESLEDDGTSNYTGKLKVSAGLTDFTSSNIPSRPNPVNIELTPEIIIIIKVEIEKTLEKARELIASRDQAILGKLTEISASIQHDDDPKKSLTTLAAFLSTQQIPEVRQLGLPTKEKKEKLEKEFKKLSIHQIYDFMDKQIKSSLPPLKEELINIKKELQKVADENQLDHPKIRAGSELILDFSNFCLLKNNLQDLLTINKNPLLTITETVDSSKESAEGLSALYAELSKELSSRSVQEENSEHLKKILREIFILENPDNYSVTSDTPHLHIAAQLRKINTHVAEKLLKRFPEIPVYNETTPLLLAASVGNNNMVQALLENSTICDKLIDQTFPSKKTTPLDISLDNGHSYIHDHSKIY